VFLDKIRKVLIGNSTASILPQGALFLSVDNNVCCAMEGGSSMPVGLGSGVLTGVCGGVLEGRLWLSGVRVSVLMLFIGGVGSGFGWLGC